MPLDSTSEPAVELRNVSKRFGQLTVLDRLSLTVACGERLFIIGPSGSGKSTVLRIIMTLERPDEGEVWINGRNLYPSQPPGLRRRTDQRHLRTIRRDVGMVFQQFNLFDHMRVINNVMEGPMRSLGLPRPEAERRARELLERVGLADKSRAWPAQLSGGQKQRVAIARALAMQPKIMLFDEITSALDPEIAAEVLKLVRELAGQLSMTMLFVTHQMHFARTMADRIIFFDGGHIIEQGPPEAVLDQPKEKRTQDFLASLTEVS